MEGVPSFLNILNLSERRLFHCDMFCYKDNTHDWCYFNICIQLLITGKSQTKRPVQIKNNTIVNLKTKKYSSLHLYI